MRAAIPFALSLALSSCSGDVCPEIDCENRSEISFPSGLVDGPYDLTITAEIGSFTARCLQPGAPEADMNPAELDCDRNGFTFEGGDFASMRELSVTIVDVATGDTLAEGVSVDANVVEELTPNGPDCPGICFVRNGAVRVSNGSESN